MPFDETQARARVMKALSRTDSPASMFNHATLALDQDWTESFRRISAPVLVIHGTNDPIIPVANGRAIAEGIDDAALLVLPGVGHEIPVPVIGVIADRIADHVRGVPGSLE